MSLADDVAAMMADTALTVPVVYGARTTRGFLDRGSRIVTDANGQPYQETGVWLHVAADDAVVGEIAQNETVTVNGTAYRTGQRDTDGDGAVLVIHLRRV